MGTPSTPATLYQRATRAVRTTSSQTTAQLAELRLGLACAERLLEAEQASAVVSPGVPAVASPDLFLEALKDEEASLNVVREKQAAVTKRLRLMSTELHRQSAGPASSTAEPDRDAEEVDSVDAEQGLQDLLSLARS
jgi:hypothetical protein